jgi:pimeloyl-ACP methyl ester carboxylesterase
MTDQQRLSRRYFEIRASGHRLCAAYIEPAGSVSPQARPTIIFLHEGLGSIAQWRDFPERVSIATGLPAFVYERWGHGKSEPLTGPRRSDYLHDEARVLGEIADICTGRDVILIGHSDGGSIALLYASSSRTVRGVVTEAAHVFVEDVSVEGIRKAVTAFGKEGLREKLARFHGPNTDAVFWGWADIWLSPEFRSWNIESCLKGVACPVLAIQGRDDEYGTPAQVEAIVKGAGGRADALLIEGCGHVPHFQAPGQVLSAIIRFIASLNI